MQQSRAAVLLCASKIQQQKRDNAANVQQKKTEGTNPLSCVLHSYANVSYADGLRVTPVPVRRVFGLVLVGI